MSSETANHISPQPKPMCPTIDKIVKYVEEAQKQVKRNMVFSEDELHDACSEVDNLLDGVPECMEDLRRGIEDLRAWGQEWKDLALETQKSLSQYE